MMGAKHISLRILTLSQSTLKMQRSICPITHPAPPSSSVVWAKILSTSPQMSVFILPHTFTHLPNSQPFALLIKPRHSPAQICLKGQEKELPYAQGMEARLKSEESTSNFINCKVIPNFFSIAQRKKEGIWFPLPWAAALT